MSRLFYGGIPTAPDVNKLMEAFDPVGGVSITYEDIEKTIGVAYPSNRFLTVVARWRRVVFRERNIQSRAEGKTLHFLTDDQAQDEGRSRFSKIGRAVGRHRVRIEAIDADNLTSEEKRAENRLLRRYAAELHEQTAKTVRSITPPRPVGNALRLGTGGIQN